jgi:NADH dehydrogenase FAD-containing subunit
MVVEGFEDQLVFPLDRVFPAGSPSRTVRGWATGVAPSAKTLTYQPLDAAAAPAGAPVPLAYDYLILACGASNTVQWAGSDSHGAYKGRLRAIRAALAAAPAALVVGGGAVGIELAGEIRDAHPAKAVTLATSAPALLANDPQAVPAMVAATAAAVAAAGIALHAGARVEGLGALGQRADVRTLSPGVYAAAAPGATFPVAVGGRTLDVGIAFACLGSTPCTAWLRGGELSGALDGAGCIRVGRSYQVEGQKCIFAIGDCCATAAGESKGVFRAEDQAGIAAGNCAALARGGALALGPDFAKAGPILVVPVGRKHGVGQVPGLCAKNIVSFVSAFKSRDYLTPVFAGKVGYTVAEGLAANQGVAPQ